MIVYVLLATNRTTNNVFVPFVFLNLEEARKQRDTMIELNNIWKKVVIKAREVRV